MAHYAFLDENNIVTEVITGKDEHDLPHFILSWEHHYSKIRNQTCKQTSYNTHNNEHKTGGTPFRGNFAGIGYTYDETNDVFIPPSPYASWQLNTSIWDWEPPIPKPDETNIYVWDEDNVNWEQIVLPE